MILKVFIPIVVLLLTGCDNSDNYPIFDKDPFLTVYIHGPPDGYKGIISRSIEFAKTRGLEIEYSTSHFRPNEYSAFIQGVDTNIFVANVGRDNVTMLTAYSRSNPTSAQRRLVSDYQCFTFYKCAQLPLQFTKRSPELR